MVNYALIALNKLVREPGFGGRDLISAPGRIPAAITCEKFSNWKNFLVDVYVNVTYFAGISIRQLLPATARKGSDMTSRLKDPFAERDRLMGVPEETGDPQQDTFTIGELSREFGVTLRTLRFYEDKDLLNPERQGLNRLYSRRDRARLKLVLMGKRVGFSLTEIRELIDLYDLRDGQVTQLRVSRDRFEKQIAKLEVQRQDIDDALGQLNSALAAVNDMLTEREKLAG